MNIFGAMYSYYYEPKVELMLEQAGFDLVAQFEFPAEGLLALDT